MHYLLIPYSLLAGIYLLHFARQREASDRFGMVVVAVGILLLLAFAAVIRPVAGDSWRYNLGFQIMRNMSLPDALAFRGTDPLFTLLNWLVGQISAAPAALFAATFSIYICGFIVAVNRLVGPVKTISVVMAYSMYPYFIAYGVSGLRQGLSLVFLLIGIVCLAQAQRKAWIWLLIGPLWHSGSWLAVGVIGLHQLLYRYVHNPRIRLIVVAAAFAGVTFLSVSGINQDLMQRLLDYLTIQKSHQIYFEDAASQGIAYRTGFRLDFYLFSLVPVLTGWLMSRKIDSTRKPALMWWLTLYLALNMLYHLFSFAPFSDRFASFSWFLMPLIVFLQVWHSRRPRLIFNVTLGIICINILMLQFYTGHFLIEPAWW